MSSIFAFLQFLYQKFNLLRNENENLFKSNFTNFDEFSGFCFSKSHSEKKNVEKEMISASIYAKDQNLLDSQISCDVATKIVEFSEDGFRKVSKNVRS